MKQHRINDVGHGPVSQFFRFLSLSISMYPDDSTLIVATVLFSCETTNSNGR